MKYYSQPQTGQDEVVLEILENKKNGYFIDIGCHDAFSISNTATMETELGWKGLGFDLEINESWTQRPNTKTYEADILTLNLEKIFAEEDVPEVVDFLNVDLEPWQPTFEAFKMIPHDKYKFRTIAFEHDGYRSGAGWVSMTNNYITSLGYKFHSMLNNQDNIYVLEE